MSRTWTSTREWKKPSSKMFGIKSPVSTINEIGDGARELLTESDSVKQKRLAVLIRKDIRYLRRKIARKRMTPHQLENFCRALQLIGNTLLPVSVATSSPT